MIRKSLTLFALSIFASSSVFATLTSHKEWGVPEVKLTLTQSKNNSRLYNAYMHKAKSDQKVTQWLQANCDIKHIQFMEDQKSVEATADNSYFLANYTSEYQIYTVTQSACTGKIEGDVYKEDHCSNSSSVYAIAPQSAEFSSGNALMTWTDVTPGNYMISFGTSVQNSDGDTVFTNNDFKFIAIPDTEKK